MPETQETISRWLSATFPGADPASPRKALRALEEMIELCLASGASRYEIMSAASRGLLAGDDILARNPEPAKVPAEAADVLIVLYGLAAIRGFDLHAEVDRKMAINRHEREWIPRGDGTGYHKEKGDADG